jgi:glycosyltransferase involved in cell wall biosynthesis
LRCAVGQVVGPAIGRVGPPDWIERAGVEESGLPAVRVIHLADYGGPYPGSFVPMLRAVNDVAQQRGWSFEAVFTPIAAPRQWYSELARDGVGVRIAPTRRRGELTTWLREVLAEQDGPTVLHTHFTTFDLPAVANALWSSRVKVFWHLHSRFASGLRPTIKNATKFAVASRRVAAILCVSDELRDNAHARLAPDRRLLVFPNAIDLHHFLRATAQDRSDARAELGVPSGRPTLLHFGWHWETKGGELFVQTIAELLHAGVEVTGLCVGGGDPARAASERLGVEERVHVISPRDDVRTLYAAADVFVSCSRAEGAPFAVFEALATGTPVVASDIPSHVHVAETAEGCALAEREPRSFARVLQSVLSARAEGQYPVDLGELGRSLDVRAWANRLTELYVEKS